MLKIIITIILLFTFNSLRAQPATKADIQEIKQEIKELRKDVDNLKNEVLLIRKDIESLKAYVQVEVKRLDEKMDILTWALGLIILLFGIPQFYTWSISMRKEKPKAKSIIEEVKSMNNEELSELKKALKIQ
jgi:hypothetical protein